MKNDHIKEVLNSYILDLGKHGFTSRQCDYDAVAPSNEEAGCHVLWMCHETLKKVGIDGEEAKVNRWLGFIQGTIWNLGIHSVSAMRAHNRTPKSALS